MSVRVMTAVWDIMLPDSEKIVLLALADCANDEGWCWPSMATIARKCSKSDRTVQGAIAALVNAGHLTRIETPGKGCKYRVHPRSDCTPEATSPPKPLREPPKPLRGTPEAASDKPSKNHQEPSKGGAPARAAPPPDELNGKDETGKRAVRLPDDWQAPAVDELPPMAAQLVRQWPAGAYAAVCETFRLHFLSETRAIGRKSNWTAALGKWLINDHPKVMRDAKAGVSFANLEPRRADAPAPKRRAVKAKAMEDRRSAAIRSALAEQFGADVVAHWLGTAAIIVDPPGVKIIVASEVQRSWIDDQWKGQIGKAAQGVIGRKPNWVTLEIESSKGSE